MSKGERLGKPPINVFHLSFKSTKSGVYIIMCFLAHSHVHIHGPCFHYRSEIEELKEKVRAMNVSVVYCHGHLAPGIFYRYFLYIFGKEELAWR